MPVFRKPTALESWTTTPFASISRLTVSHSVSCPAAYHSSFIYFYLFFKSFFSGHVIYFLKGDLPGSTRLVMEFQNIEGLVSNTPPKLEFSKIGGAISSQVFKVVVKKIIFLEPPMDMPVNTKKIFGLHAPKNFLLKNL